jgi:hypothetical protein
MDLHNATDHGRRIRHTLGVFVKDLEPTKLKTDCERRQVDAKTSVVFQMKLKP